MPPLPEKNIQALHSTRGPEALNPDPFLLLQSNRKSSVLAIIFHSNVARKLLETNKGLPRKSFDPVKMRHRRVHPNRNPQLNHKRSHCYGFRCLRAHDSSSKKKRRLVQSALGVGEKNGRFKLLLGGKHGGEVGPIKKK
uniref:Uncharacterized protein n=1 Tax=Rhizophora mucronata TaxID=61149 RepID=A0A2P2J887_RHIMU